jgi:hypothetical protein
MSPLNWRRPIEPVFITPPAEPRMSSRAWRNLDRQVTAELASIDRDLSAWARHEPKTEAVDYLLDARLYIRPPDVMESGQITPGRPS